MPGDPNGGAGAGGEDADEDLGAAIHAAAEGSEGGGGGGEGGGEGAGGDGKEGAEGADGGDGGDGAEAPLTAQEARAMRQELSDLRSWREQQEQGQVKTREQEEAARNQPPKPLSDEEFAKLEGRFGFVRSKDKDTGEERMAINPRQLIENVSNMIDFAVGEVRKQMEGALHENVSSLRLRDSFESLEKDPSKEFTDIRQYSKAISDMLAKRYQPKDRTNRDYIISAFYEAKGRGLKDTVKKIENGRELNKKVVHPAGAGAGGGAPKGGAPKPTGAAGQFLAAFDK